MFKFLTGVLTGFIAGGLVWVFGMKAYDDTEASNRERKMRLAENRGYNNGLKQGFTACISGEYTVWSSPKAGDPKFVMTPYNKNNRDFIVRSDEAGYDKI